MVTLQGKINSARDEVIKHRDNNRNSKVMRRFTSAVLTTGAICGVYTLARYFSGIDFDQYISYTADRIITYVGCVSFVVGGFGLMRMYQDERKISVAKEKLDNLMIDLAKKEYRRNQHFGKNYGNRNRSDLDS